MFSVVQLGGFCFCIPHTRSAGQVQQSHLTLLASSTRLRVRKLYYVRAYVSRRASELMEKINSSWSSQVDVQ